jgi:hypothetical protein
MQRPRYRPSFFRSLGGLQQTLHFYGNKYRLYADEREVVDYLQDLGWFLFATSDELQPATLLRSRRDLRAILERPTIGALVALLAKGDVLTSRWAIWLLGHSRNKSAVAPLRPYLQHPEPTFRKEAARALRRLGAWGELVALQQDRDERIRRLATPRPEPEYLKPPPPPEAPTAAARFARALERLREHSLAGERGPAPEGSPMPYWSAASLGEGKPPRPDWWLRRILLRIHEAIRGSARAGS